MIKSQNTKWGIAVCLYSDTENCRVFTRQSSPNTKFFFRKNSSLIDARCKAWKITDDDDDDYTTTKENEIKRVGLKSYFVEKDPGTEWWR